jgi:hypothetical protein
MTVALRAYLCGVSLCWLASAGVAQRADLSVDQLTPRQASDMAQLGPAETQPPRIPQLDQRTAPPAAPLQVGVRRTGRDPQIRQLAPRGAAARTATTQLAKRTTDPRLSALPPGLVDACTEAVAGRGAPPPGVDCTTLVEAAPPPPPISAEEALLTSATERNARRIASEQIGRGQTVDAGEVARRLSIGDLTNAPVAQAVAAQAAAEAAVAAPSTPQPGNRPTIVPGSGIVVIPPGQR